MAVSPHVRRLRELVGHELLVLPSVAALPRNEAGEILLVRVTDTDQWATTGGAAEPDGSPEQAALRKAEEEVPATQIGTSAPVRSRAPGA